METSDGARCELQKNEKNSCCCILDDLQWTNGAQRLTCKERDAVVRSPNVKGPTKQLSGLCG